jgi:hypothetical protein
MSEQRFKWKADAGLIAVCLLPLTIPVVAWLLDA